MPDHSPTHDRRPIHAAVLLAVGSELVHGETRDTNSGDLARSLTRRGVEVLRSVSLPDRRDLVERALRDGLGDADLVVTTGGLGPTPDDLTRESIAAVLGETPSVDPALEAWLRRLFTRRGMAFPETNVKQAWLIPSATAIPNDRGTAPGWWVEAGDGRIILALPGPPTEMRAMWEGWALPRLAERGLGRELLIRTYRLTGIGESHVAHALGEPLLRAENPIVATYARADAVDVRISARAEGERPASELLAEAEAAVVAAVGRHVWARDDESWPDALGRILREQGWTAGVAEVGTGGSTARLLGDAEWLAGLRLLGGGDPAAGDRIEDLAASAAATAGAPIGVAVRCGEAGGDTSVELAAFGPWGTASDRRVAFLGGAEGRRRAALLAAAFLFETLRGATPVNGAPPAPDPRTASADPGENRARPGSGGTESRGFAAPDAERPSDPRAARMED